MKRPAEIALKLLLYSFLSVVAVVMAIAATIWLLMLLDYLI